MTIIKKYFSLLVRNEILNHPSTLLLCALLIASCGPSRETTKEAVPSTEKKVITSTVKILSVNSLHALSDKTEVKRFASWLKKTGAEVIAVQQIERPTETKPGFDAVKELAKQLEMYEYFGKSRYYQGFDSGNSLFSTYPIKQSNTYQLPVGKGKVRRSVAYGVIDLGLRMVGFGSAELDDQSASERSMQVDEIYSFSKSIGEYPLVVCGMFYEPSTGKAATKMTEHFSSANALNAVTTKMEQHLYAVSPSKIKPIATERVQFGTNKTEAVLVTLEISE